MGSYELDVSPLTPELQEKAKNELRETPEIVSKAIEELRELIKADSSIRFGDDEKLLMVYLRARHFYPESAYRLIKSGAEFKEKYKTILHDLIPITMKHLCETTDVVHIFTSRDQDGRRVLVIKQGGEWDPNVISSEQIFQIVYMFCIAATQEERTQVNGVVVILDCKNMGMKQIACLGPAVSVRLLSYIQDVMPLRMKEVHIINEPFIFNLVWKIFKPLIKEKLSKRIFFHGSKKESLTKYIKPECLPSNYGGTLPAVTNSLKSWYPTLEESTDYIQRVNSYGLVK